MTTPAIDTLSFPEVYTFFEQIFDLLQDPEQKRIYNLSPRRILVNTFYDNELVYPIAQNDLRDVFLSTRKFLQNDSDDVVTVVGDFVPWDFQPRIVYCCSNLELGYFLGKAKQLGLPLIEDTYEGWLDQDDPPRSYFWS